MSRAFTIRAAATLARAGVSVTTLAPAGCFDAAMLVLSNRVPGAGSKVAIEMFHAAGLKAEEIWPVVHAAARIHGLREVTIEEVQWLCDKLDNDIQ